MNIYFILLAPLLGIGLYSVGVVFWTGISHLRYIAFYRREGLSPPPLGVPGWTQFYKRTLVGALYLLWWSIRAAGKLGLRQPEGPTTGRPVLCVHGIFMNGTSMWGIRRSLEKRGRATRTVSLGVPIPSPIVYAGPLTTAMDEMANEFPNEGFDIVAHSLGGVMVREVLRRRPDLAPSIGRIVTLGTPHHGTAFLRWMRFGPLYRILSRQSVYLAELPVFAESAPQAEITTVATKQDLVVYPLATAHLDGAEQITLTAVSHLGLMTERGVFELVDQALN